MALGMCFARWVDFHSFEDRVGTILDTFFFIVKVVPDLFRKFRKKTQQAKGRKSNPPAISPAEITSYHWVV